MPAVSKAQQATAAIALKAKDEGNTKGLKEPAKSMSKMTKQELEKFAKTKRKPLPKHKAKKSVKEHYMGAPESMQPDAAQPEYEDNIGVVFVVLKPQNNSRPADIVHQTDAFGLGQFDRSNIHGVYRDEDEANLVAEAQCSGMRKRLSELEKKKDTVMETIDGHIAKLQKEINKHMKEATQRPEMAESHHNLAERKMATIRNLREKYKRVKSAKKELPKWD